MDNAKEANFQNQQQDSFPQTAQQYATQTPDPACGAIGGAATVVENQYRPPTFTERLEKNLAHAEAKSAKRHKLRELARLLDKNPDVARILDLIEEVSY